MPNISGNYVVNCVWWKHIFSYKMFSNPVQLINMTCLNIKIRKLPLISYQLFLRNCGSTKNKQSKTNLININEIVSQKFAFKNRNFHYFTCLVAWISWQKFHYLRGWLGHKKKLNIDPCFTEMTFKSILKEKESVSKDFFC